MHLTFRVGTGDLQLSAPEQFRLVWVDAEIAVVLLARLQRTGRVITPFTATPPWLMYRATLTEGAHPWLVLICSLDRSI